MHAGAWILLIIFVTCTTAGRPRACATDHTILPAQARRKRPALRLIRLEVHRNAVDAVAQVRRRRAVVEHMAEMAAAAAAMHLGAHHAVGTVARGLGRARSRIVEARPAGAALELHFRREQLL